MSLRNSLPTATNWSLNVRPSDPTNGVHYCFTKCSRCEQLLQVWGNGQFLVFSNLWHYRLFLFFGEDTHFTAASAVALLKGNYQELPQIVQIYIITLHIPRLGKCIIISLSYPLPPPPPSAIDHWVGERGRGNICVVEQALKRLRICTLWEMRELCMLAKNKNVTRMWHWAVSGW